ncbi:MAG: sugar transporter, partial [Flavobacteriaceae bacterium]|nr:sugar transporter [Flavobacteriaceae bacterium]
MENTNLENMEGMDSGRVSFDFRGYLFKALNLWKLVLVCIGFALIIAYLINIRKQNVYRLDSLITVENDQNPFFTANTSISFNWGGVSGKVGKIITTVKTRSHNELVVDSLKFYMRYMVDGKYRKLDIYKRAPFRFKIDKAKGQLLNKHIGIRFLNNEEFEVFTDFDGPRGVVQFYSDKSKAGVTIPQGEFAQVFSVNQPIDLPFLNGTITLRPGVKVNPGAEYYLFFANFDNVVNSYKNQVKIATFSPSSSSVLTLSLTGMNKAKIVDYLNTTAAILSQTELRLKNQYATNTIKFIDSSLAAVNVNLRDVTDEMNDFRQKNKVFNVNEEMSVISSQLRVLDTDEQSERIKLDYLDNLEKYLNTKTDYSKIAAPTSVGIEEPNILSSVGKITNLSIQRQN